MALESKVKVKITNNSESVCMALNVRTPFHILMKGADIWHNESQWCGLQQKILIPGMAFD